MYIGTSEIKGEMSVLMFVQNVGLKVQEVVRFAQQFDEE